MARRGIMSGDIPIQVIVAAFQEEDGADEAIIELKAAQRERLIKIDDAAILRCDRSGKLHIKETADMGGGKGSVIGGVTGAVLGLLAGPVGWGIGIGALVGGLAAKLRDTGFSDARLRELGRGLQPGSSALVAVVEHIWVRDVERELEKQGADIITEELRKDIANQLEAGRDVAYSALSMAGALDIERQVSGKDYSETELLVANDRGIVAGVASADKERIVATVGVYTDQDATVVTREYGRVDPDVTEDPATAGSGHSEEQPTEPPPASPATPS